MSCTGLYTDTLYTVSHSSIYSKGNGIKLLADLYEKNEEHKKLFAKNLVFDPTSESFSKLFDTLNIFLESDSSVTHEPQVINIYFDTGSFDEIEKGRKVTLEAQLGVIGGTMGLFTGFSLVSAVEIVYFVIRLFMSIFHK